jgi:hypothetical protein
MRSERDVAALTLRGILAAALLLAALPAGAQTAPARQPGWIADARGCQVWNPTPKANQTVTWSGPCQNKLAQGRGVLQWYVNNRPTDRYDGELVAGKLDGRGTYVSADGFRFEGEWRDGKANGDGELTTKTGAFNGTWRDGCFREGNRRAWVGVAASTCQ